MKACTKLGNTATLLQSRILAYSSLPLCQLRAHWFPCKITFSSHFCHVNSLCREGRYKQLFDHSDNCHSWVELKTFCTFVKEEMNESEKDSSKFSHQELMMKCPELILLWPSLSLLTLKTWRHELSGGHAVRLLDGTHLECSIMSKWWPSSVSALPPCWAVSRPIVTIGWKRTGGRESKVLFKNKEGTARCEVEVI